MTRQEARPAGSPCSVAAPFTELLILTKSDGDAVQKVYTERRDGRFDRRSEPRAFWWRVAHRRRIAELKDLEGAVRERERAGGGIIPGQLREDADPTSFRKGFKEAKGVPPGLLNWEHSPRVNWGVFDIDKKTIPTCIANRIPAGWIPGEDLEVDRALHRAAFEYFLPMLKGVGFVAFWSSSARWEKEKEKEDEDVYKLLPTGLADWRAQYFVVFDAPVSLRRFQTYLKTIAKEADATAATPSQACYGGPRVVDRANNVLPDVIRDRITRCDGHAAPIAAALDELEARAAAKAARAARRRPTAPTWSTPDGERAVPKGMPAGDLPRGTRDAIDSFGEALWRWCEESIRTTVGEARHKAILATAQQIKAYCDHPSTGWSWAHWEATIITAAARAGRKNENATRRAVQWGASHPSGSITDRINKIIAAAPARSVNVQEARRKLPELCRSGWQDAARVHLIRATTGAGKSTAQAREAAKRQRRDVVTVPSRVVGLEQTAKLRAEGVTAFFLPGRTIGKKHANETLEEAYKDRGGSTFTPGPLHDADGHLVDLVTCGNYDVLKAIADGKSARSACRQCGFAKRCKEGGGYLGRKAALEGHTGAAVEVYTEPMRRVRAELDVRPLDAETRDDAGHRLHRVELTSDGYNTLKRSLAGRIGSIRSELARREKQTDLIAQTDATEELAEERRRLERVFAAPFFKALAAAFTSAEASHQAKVAEGDEGAKRHGTVAHATGLPGASEDFREAVEELARADGLDRAQAAFLREAAARPQWVEGGYRNKDKSYLVAFAEPAAPEGGCVVLDATATAREVQAALRRPVKVVDLSLEVPDCLKGYIVQAGKWEGSEGGRKAHAALAMMQEEFQRVYEARRAAGEAKPVAYIVVHAAIREEMERPIPAHRTWREAFSVLEAVGFDLKIGHWFDTTGRGSNRYEDAAVVVAIGTPYKNGGAFIEEERAIARRLGEVLPETTDDVGPAWKDDAVATATQAHGRARSQSNGKPTVHVSIGQAHPRFIEQAIAKGQGTRSSSRTLDRDARILEHRILLRADAEGLLKMDPDTLSKGCKALGLASFAVQTGKRGRPKTGYAKPGVEVAEIGALLIARGRVFEKVVLTCGMNKTEVAYKDLIGQPGFNPPRPSTPAPVTRPALTSLLPITPSGTVLGRPALLARPLAGFEGVPTLPIYSFILQLSYSDLQRLAEPSRSAALRTDWRRFHAEDPGGRIIWVLGEPRWLSGAWLKAPCPGLIENRGARELLRSVLGESTPSGRAAVFAELMGYSSEGLAGRPPPSPPTFIPACIF